MIEQTVRWFPPRPDRYFIWDGVSLEELNLILPSLSPDGWVAQFEGDAGAVVMTNEVGETMAMEAGDFLSEGPTVYPAASGAPGLPYPSEWLD